MFNKPQNKRDMQRTGQFKNEYYEEYQDHRGKNMHTQQVPGLDAYGRFQADNLLDDLGRYVDVQNSDHIQPHAYHMHPYG